MAKLRSSYESRSKLPPRHEILAELQTAKDSEEIVALLEQLDCRGQSDAFRVAHLVDHPDPDVREALAYALGGFSQKAAAALIETLRSDSVEAVREAAGAD